MKPNLLPLLLVTTIISCNEAEDKPAGRDGWLKGNEDEKFETITKQLRGFDMAMVETGYRYTELYWAGQDANWEYANYQLDKIKTAIDVALVRRPKRAPSSQIFLENAVPAMRAAIEKKDTVEFNKGFVIFQSACRSCHIAEKVPYMPVSIPEYRSSPTKLIRE